MIEQTLFNFTTGETLELNGEPYTGYYNVTNKNLYTGREVSRQSSFLTASDNALGNFLKEKLYFNRLPIETLGLPYSKDDVLFEPGEFVNQNSINDKLKKLNDNYLELYNFTSAQDNNLPQGFIGFIGVSALNNQSFGLNVTPTNRFNTQLSAAAGNADMNNVHRVEVLPRRLKPTETNPSVFVSIYASLSGIYTFTCPNTLSNTRYTFRAATSSVDGFNTRRYNNIADITTNGKDILYVSDTVHNQIYRLYIDPLVNDSRISGNDLEYLNKGGVEINTTGNGILSSADLIEYGLNELYTYNTGTKTFVVLGKDLTFKRRFTNKEIKDNSPVSFAVNTVDKKLYVLLDNFKILKIPVDFKTEIETITLANAFAPIETPKKIFFSKNNSNIYYVMTTYNLYKYFNVGSDEPIGNFNWNRTYVPNLTSDGFLRPDNSLFDAAILDENNNYDSLFILEKNQTQDSSTKVITTTGIDKILRCNEPNGRIKLLENETFRSFSLNDILVNDQYFNSLTLNKSLKKLMFNMDILSSYLQSKFTLEYNEFNNLKSTGKVTLTATPLLVKEYDMFVGSNEVVTPQVFNRCMRRLIDSQAYMLDILQGKLTNKKYTTTELVVISAGLAS